ncbi:hypothetical protein ACOME3_001443 [Neoechinorhynchus agilis]
MLLLFETAAGYALFKVSDDDRWSELTNLGTDMSIDASKSDKLNTIFNLHDFQRFEDTGHALQAVTQSTDGQISHPLKKLLKKLVKREIQDPLLVADAKLGQAIKEKYNLQCLTTTPVQNLMRAVRDNFSKLFDNLQEKEAEAMRVGLAHSLGRYKIKFTPEKADIMVVQAVSLLDELDKDLNNYIMRSREWYGCHFPELTNLIDDHVLYARVVNAIGLREDAENVSLSNIVENCDEGLEAKIKEAAQTSIGTELSDEDIESVRHLCDQVISLSEYRNHLQDYLKNRMFAIAPNLSVLVGELLAARLIAKAGSLTNLAKYPASTVQILGAEKALFRALKTKHDTPKYGLMFHASIVGKTQNKLKGKVCRMLAAKSSLAARYDALSDGAQDDAPADPNCCDFGIKARASIEARVFNLEQGKLRAISGRGKAESMLSKAPKEMSTKTYDATMDSTLVHHKRKSTKPIEEVEGKKPKTKE